jgi:hypothetical protein
MTREPNCTAGGSSEGGDILARLFRELRSELGNAHSPAYDAVSAAIGAGVEVPHAMAIQIAGMCEDRCWADTQSYRRGRGRALWQLLCERRDATYIALTRMDAETRKRYLERYLSRIP